jgi:hypothetical protein
VWDGARWPGLLLGFGAAAAFACGPEPAAAPAAAAEAEAPAEGGATLRYGVEEDGRRQQLEVRERAGGSIEIRIAVQGSCARSEAGVAEPAPAEGDLDVEVDPNGEGHPTDTFFLTPRPECTIGIRLALDERSYAWLRESGCGSACPLSEEPMGRR